MFKLTSCQILQACIRLASLQGLILPCFFFAFLLFFFFFSNKSAPFNKFLYLEEKIGLEFIDLLCSHPRIDLNIQDCMGRTPCSIAVSNQHVKIVQRLVENKCMPSINCFSK